MLFLFTILILLATLRYLGIKYFQISIRGAYSWIDTPKEKRQLNASNGCSCKACKENWPTLDELESYHVNKHGYFQQLF